MKRACAWIAWGITFFVIIPAVRLTMLLEKMLRPDPPDADDLHDL